MWVAPVVKMSVWNFCIRKISYLMVPIQEREGRRETLAFFVSCCGVVRSFMGPSAHGLDADGSEVVIMNGERVKRSPIRTGMARSTERRVVDIGASWKVEVWEEEDWER